MILKSPFGTWELALPETTELQERFTSGNIEDILLVISYSARTAYWPR